MEYIIILAGQSNMEGLTLKVKRTTLPKRYSKKPQNIALYEKGSKVDLLKKDRFGPEVGCAYEISKNQPQTSFHFLKVGVSGANLYYDWNPDGVSRGPEDEYRGPVYPRLMKELNDLKELLNKRKVDYRIAGFLWMQGERDSVFDHMANSYEKNLETFIQKVREDVEVPDLPFIIGEIDPRIINLDSGLRQHRFRDVVIAAQHSLAEKLNHVSIIKTHDLPQTDNLHFNLEGQLELGKKFARKILEYHEK